MRKTRLAAAATAAAILLAAAACSTGGGNVEASGDGSEFTYRIPDRFKNWLEDNRWNEPLQEGAGVEVNLVAGGPEDRHYEQLDLILGDGTLEDATVATMAQAQVYGRQGALLDLAPLIEEHAPNLQRYIEENPDYRNLVQNTDGSIYGLVNEYPRISILSFYRQDMFEEAGISSAPTSVEDFTEALRNLKTTFGDDGNYYPLGGRDDFINYQYAFGANDRIDKETNEVHGIYESGHGLDIHADGFRDMIEWYNALYEERLIDPEWVRGQATEETWQTQMLTGAISVSNDFFTRPFWFMTNADRDTYPDYQMATMPALKNDGEQMYQPAEPRYNTERVFVASANTDNSLAIIKFLDHLYSEEGQRTYHYGVEGESYEVVDGEPEYIVEYEENTDQDVGTPVWNFMQDRLTYPAPVNDDAFYKWQDDFTKDFASDYFENYLVEYPVLQYTPEQLEERTRLLASVEPFVDAQLVEFVSGDTPLSEWNSFLQEADAMGYRDITAIDQEAWDAQRS
ncbi:hypothetical protein GCM10023169_29700 [Georgenia halophila]|uniref:Extracellular solute-binding protein n=1 Tax=Georgenia halophila TaxID=620889 RepID=A0ABP8LHV7_9MICO